LTRVGSAFAHEHPFHVGEQRQHCDPALGEVGIRSGPGDLAGVSRNLDPPLLD
jgi:hypothetical protein